MKRGLVIGEIWATRKAPGLAGRQLKLVLEYPDSPEPPQGRWSPPQVAALGMAPLVVAVDTLDVRSGQEVLLAYGSGLRTGPDNNQTVPAHVRVDATLQYAFDMVPLRPRLAIDLVNVFDAHYAYRIGNAFVGSSYAAPRSVFVRLAIPLSSGSARDGNGGGR